MESGLPSNPNGALSFVGQVNPVRDSLSRPLQDLRISLTDHCNFRCRYCMPKEVFGPNFAFLPKEALLLDDEIVRLARIFARLGVRKLRLTGGEPLLRPALAGLIQQLSQIDGIEDISLTTNGSLLTAQKAIELKRAGLHRVTISLDSLDNETFMRLNDVHCSVETVLAAIDAANTAKLTPVKVNMVVIKGINDHEVVSMAEYFRGTGIIVRFIEYMDVGNSNHWQMEQVYSAKEMLDAISAKWPLAQAQRTHPGEVASRYCYEDGQGEIGIISSVTAPFCQACTRARLSAEGKLFMCLFASSGFDLRHHLRSGETDEAIADRIAQLWSKRDDRYSELRFSQKEPKSKVEMSHIGG